MDWHLFEKSSLTLDRQERVLGAAEGEYDFAAIRGTLIKFPCHACGPPSVSLMSRHEADLLDKLSFASQTEEGASCGRRLHHEWVYWQECPSNFGPAAKCACNHWN